MRIVVATCSVDYAGRLSAHLPVATRLLILKADGSVLVHADQLSYKPLNWMSPPCAFEVLEADDEERLELDAAGVTQRWRVTHAKTADQLVISIHEILHDSHHELGVDPGLRKDGVESDLQRLLAEQVELIGEGTSLVRREYPTAIGPVDLLVTDAAGATIAVEIKRRGGIDGSLVKPHAATSNGGHVAVEVKRKAGIDAVEQLTRYLALLNRDSHLAPVRGVLAAQSIAPQARTLANDRGIEVLLLDYDAMRGLDDGVSRLF